MKQNKLKKLRLSEEMIVSQLQTVQAWKKKEELKVSGLLRRRDELKEQLKTANQDLAGFRETMKYLKQREASLTKRLNKNKEAKAAAMDATAEAEAEEKTA